MREKKVLTGDALVNKIAMIVIEVICGALIFGYIADYATSGEAISFSRWLYFGVFETSAVLTSILVVVAYIKWSKNMKYIAFICFAIVYFIGLIGSGEDVAFVMAFPIVVVFILYYDNTLIKLMAFTFGLISIIDCVYIVVGLKRLHSGAAIRSGVLLMEVLATNIFLIAVVVVTKISKRNNEDKLNQIKAAADQLNHSIHDINNELNQLNISSSAAKTAMEEINQGITNTASAVSNQLYQTESIQERIENVSDVANNISTNVNETLAAVEVGKQDMVNLVNQADVSVSISEKVTSDLTILQENIDAMKSITQMIESIAFQTNLMALNANVEAAHAGEIGRGFAVVATEISNMSTQTKKATNDISDLIKNATASLSELSGSITKMTEIIAEEKKQTTQTSEVFNTIENRTDEVKTHVNNFMNYVNGLTDANREIVQSVQTISATTQEVTALANEALAKEKHNAKTVENITLQVSELAK